MKVSGRDRLTTAKLGIALTQFYEDDISIFVEAYDAFYGSDDSKRSGDIEFYVDIARETTGDVLEIACGTGRIAVPLVEAGCRVTGVDISEGMLSVAQRKAAALSEEARNRLDFVLQDMTALDLKRRFGFALIPARSFQHVRTPDLQRQVLTAVHRHLEPDGRFALHVFDPRLDFLIDETTPPRTLSGTHPVTGHRFVGEIIKVRFDHFAQLRHDLWRYTESAPDGTLLREETREMVLRWTYRWEMRHLLERCGFAVEAEYSDFHGAPPVYGKEQIWVCRAKS